MCRLRFVPILALALLTPNAGPATAAPPAREPQAPELKFEKYTLPNGLEVILHEDHTIPVVAVNVWYKVGSKDEKPGRTGFAHLFEHMMFQGSEHHDSEYFAPLESLGANLNGSTNTDRTNYYETLPSNGLERALWLESDRLGFLLPVLSQQKLDNQRDVVKNERRQRVDNQPYGLAAERMLEELYPPDHPYRHSVIGSMADLSAASLADVQNFFRTHYTPSNASLVIAGDFNPDEAKSLVAKYFGSLPKGPEVEKPKPWVPKLDAPKHAMMTDRVALARAQLTWPTVPGGHDDEAALDVLAAVLGQLDKENRLYRALMYDRQVASSVSSYHGTQQLSGTFNVVLSARPGEGLDELVKLADAEIERLTTEGPTDVEVAKAQTARETQLVTGLQGVEDRADFLNHYNVFYNDPAAYRDELKRLFAVTPEDVKRVAKQYLTPNRVRLDVNPGEKAERPPEVEVDRKGQVAVAPVVTEIKDTFDRSKMPEPGPPPEFAPPPVVRRKLSNGLEVLVAERHELPILTLDLVIKGGQTLEPVGKEGLASMTGRLLTEGTETRDALGLAGALSEIGADLGAGFQRESGSLSLTTLTKHTDQALNLFADVLLHPTFPARELERLRKETLAALLRRADNPAAVAGVVMPKTLYSEEHPYGRIETTKSVETLTREDVVALYRTLFMPNNAALIVAGDTTPDAIVAKLEEALKDWKPGEAPKPPATEVKSGDGEPTVYLVDKPGAAQSVIYVGQVGVPRSTPDYFPLTVMNAILGGQFSSRINLNLREEKGYTYGASSSFVFRQGPGPFVAGGSFQTAVTKPALIELFKELRDIRGDRPATDAEMAFAKDRIIKGFPGEFETTASLAGQLRELVQFGLPDDYFTTYLSNIEAVTKDDVTRVANKYLDPDHMIVLIVGDRSVVEPTLKELPFAKTIRVLDTDGNPVTDKPAAGAGR